MDTDLNADFLGRVSRGFPEIGFSAFRQHFRVGATPVSSLPS